MRTLVRTSKRTWLETGLRILAEQGAPALTIDRLAATLGLTKGSFYHHFQGLPGFKAALLDFIEHAMSDRVSAATADAVTPADGMARLFATSVAETPAIEVAFRAWALQDDEVRAVQERVDDQRFATVQSLCRQVVDDESRAQLMGRLAQALMIGSAQLQPPLTPAARRQLLAEFLRLYDLNLDGQPNTGSATPRRPRKKSVGGQARTDETDERHVRY
jgi:AcrR family transcriptional regulator